MLKRNLVRTDKHHHIKKLEKLPPKREKIETLKILQSS
jgi:hypothetical protein